MSQLIEASGALKPGLSPERAADIVWTLCSRASFDALVRARGWSHEEYERWLTDMLQDALLG